MSCIPRHKTGQAIAKLKNPRKQSRSVTERTELSKIRWTYRLLRKPTIKKMTHLLKEAHSLDLFDKFPEMQDKEQAKKEAVSDLPIRPQSHPLTCSPGQKAQMLPTRESTKCTENQVIMTQWAWVFLLQEKELNLCREAVFLINQMLFMTHILQAKKCEKPPILFLK